MLVQASSHLVYCCEDQRAGIKVGLWVLFSNKVHMFFCWGNPHVPICATSHRHTRSGLMKFALSSLYTHDRDLVQDHTYAQEPKSWHHIQYNRACTGVTNCVFHSLSSVSVCQHRAPHMVHTGAQTQWWKHHKYAHICVRVQLELQPQLFWVEVMLSRFSAPSGNKQNVPSLLV